LPQIIEQKTTFCQIFVTNSSGKQGAKCQTYHTLESPYKLRYMMAQKPAVWRFTTSFGKFLLKI